MSFQDVSSILWRERRLLELLEFKVAEEQLLLEAGHAQWLGLATREIEAVLDELREVELARAVAVARAADQVGLGADAALGDLVTAAPAPWDALLCEHHLALRAAAERLEKAKQEHRAQLVAGARAAKESLRRGTGVSGDG